MSEFNFDKMRNLNIPDEWAEKTIKEVNKLKKPDRKANAVTCRLVVALCLLSVCLLGVFTYALPQSNEGISYDKKYESSTSGSYNNQSLFESTTTSENTEQTEKSTSTDSTITQETQNSSVNNVIEPEESKPVKNPTTKKEPTQSTKPEKEKPTQPPSQTAPTEIETEEPTKDLENFYISITLHNDMLTGRGNVYCKTMNNGVCMGSAELFSAQHEVEIVSKDATNTYVRYYPFRQGVVIGDSDKLYVFYYYNEDGVTVAQQKFDFKKVTG